MKANDKIIYTLAIIGSIVLSIFEPAVYYLLLLMVLFSTVYLLGRKFVLVLLVILQITFTGETFLALRPYLTVVTILILLYYFLQDYGLAFKNYPKIPGLLLWFLILLFSAIFLSALFSISFSTSIYSLIKFAVFFLLCYLFYAQIKNDRDVFYYLLSLFISVIILGVSMFAEFIQKGASFFINEGALLRLAGIYDNPNYVGILLIITMPVTISYLLFNRNGNKLYNGIAFLFIAFQLTIMLLSDSRASIMSITVSAVILFIFSSKKTKTTVLSGIVLILLVLFLFTDISVFIELFLRPDRVGTREQLWLSGLEIISNNIFIGAGAETFEKLFYTNASSEIIALLSSAQSTGGTPHPHNLFIYFWAENGLPGLLVVVFFFFLYFSLSKQLIKGLKDYSDSFAMLKIAMLSIGFGVSARAFFEITGVITYGFITRDLPLWIIIMIMVYLFQNQNAQKTIKEVN